MPASTSPEPEVARPGIAAARAASTRPSGVATKVAAPFSATTAFQRRAASAARWRSGSAAIGFLVGAGQMRHLAGVRRRRAPARSKRPSRRQRDHAHRAAHRARAAPRSAGRRSAVRRRLRGRAARRACRDRAAPHRPPRAAARPAPGCARRARRPCLPRSATTRASGTAIASHGGDARAASRSSSLPAPARKAAVGGEDRGARASRALPPTTSTRPRCFLVAVGRRHRQRPARAAARRRLRRATRSSLMASAPAGTSGSLVTGAPASSSGSDEVDRAQHQLAVPAGRRIELVRGDAAVRHVGRAVDRQDLPLRPCARAGSASS